MKKPSLTPFILCLAALALFAVSCEKEIDVDLPDVVSRTVVEGTIEPGLPPVVLLSRSQGYFDPTDLTTLEDLYITGATCEVSNGSTTVTLDEVCAADLPEELLEQVADILGFSPEVLSAVNICAYTSLFNTDIWGEEGKTYTLNIDVEGEQLSSTTKINQVVELDSTWFELSGNSDSLGFLHAIITDPDTTGNAYRWFAQRLNRYPDWSEHAGEVKDASMIAPLGSVALDEFFNGLNFEFAYFRGTTTGEPKTDDLNEEAGFYKVGDTVAVRGCVIDFAAYNFIYAFETQAANQGSPFAVPSNLPSNVEGGLGAFIGYGVFNDTIICAP